MKRRKVWGVEREGMMVLLLWKCKIWKGRARKEKKGVEGRGRDIDRPNVNLLPTSSSLAHSRRGPWRMTMPDRSSPQISQWSVVVLAELVDPSAWVTPPALFGEVTKWRIDMAPERLVAGDLGMSGRNSIRKFLTISIRRGPVVLLSYFPLFRN